MPSASSNSIVPLAEQCLVHLKREELTLLETRTILQSLHQALRSGELAQIDSARSQQSQIALHMHALDQQRAILRDGIGNALSLPREQATLGRLIAFLPNPWSDEISGLRDRLQALAVEVQSLNGRNTSLIHYCRSFLRQVFEQTDTPDVTVTRYGPKGTQLGAARGNHFIAQG